MDSTTLSEIEQTTQNENPIEDVEQTTFLENDETTLQEIPVQEETTLQQRPTQEETTTPSALQILEELANRPITVPMYPNVQAPTYKKLSPAKQNLCQSANTNFQNTLKTASEQIKKDKNLERGMKTIQSSLEETFNTTLNCVSTDIFNKIQDNTDDNQSITVNLMDVKAGSIKLCSDQSISSTEKVVNYLANNVSSTNIESIKNTLNSVQQQTNTFFNVNKYPTNLPQMAMKAVLNNSANLNITNLYNEAIKKNVSNQNNVMNLKDVTVTGQLDMCSNNQTLVQNVCVKNITNNIIKNIFNPTITNALTATEGSNNNITNPIIKEIKSMKTEEIVYIAVVFFYFMVLVVLFTFIPILLLDEKFLPNVNMEKKHQAVFYIEIVIMCLGFSSWLFMLFKKEYKPYIVGAFGTIIAIVPIVIMIYTDRKEIKTNFQKNYKNLNKNIENLNKKLENTYIKLEKKIQQKNKKMRGNERK